jgi:mannose PTS system EIIA component
MIGTLIVTQGGVAREMMAAAREIAGEVAQFEAVSLAWSDGADEARAKVAAAIARVDVGQGVLILVDTFGATPCNVAWGLRAPGRVEVISGVNLPMVVRLACLGNRQDLDLAAAARWLQAKGRQAIQIAGETPAGGMEAKECAELTVGAEAAGGGRA